MSWSISLIGTPEKLAAALEAESGNLTGHSKAEYDEAKPHLIGLVSQNFGGDTPKILKITANGSGYARDGKQVERSCHSHIESLGWAKLCV